MAQGLTEADLRHWMQKLGPRLIAISAAICRDRHQAEEVVQEAFVKLWRTPPDAGPVAYTSWLKRVVTNLSINALKRTKRPRALPEYSSDPALQAGRVTDSARQAGEQVDRVRAALDRLDPAKRTILVLRAYRQLSYEEIAAHLGVPIGTVMSRLNRARAALIEEMKSNEDRAEDAGEAPATYPFRRYRQA